MGRPKKTSGIETADLDHLAGFYKKRGEYSLLPLELEGVTPLLLHAWGQKALIEMLGNMTGHEMPQQDKDLQLEYEQAFYRNVKDAAVVPCRIIKRCILDGALATKKAVYKTDLGRYLRVEGLTSPIIGEPHMDIRPVSVGGRTKTPDIRARPRFDEWSLKIVVRFSHEYISGDKVMMAIEAAGDAVGLCEWRPSSKQPGELGCFRVKHVNTSQIDSIINSCKHPERVPEIPAAFLRAASAASKNEKTPPQATNILAAISHTKNGVTSRA